MKILLVHNFYQQFGGEDSVALQEKELLEKTDDVLMYSRHNDEIRGLTLFQKATCAWNTIHSSATSADIRRILDKFKPDFAYVHNIYPLISPSLYHTLHACGVPILQVVHDFRPFCANGWFYTGGEICQACKGGNHFHAIWNKCYKDSYLVSAIYAATMDRCRRSGVIDKIDAFLCLTEFGRGLVLGLGVPPEKVFVRPNSIDVSGILPSTVEGDYVAYIGRLSSEKGPLTLLHAIEQLKGVPLKIAGAGPMKEELRTYVKHKEGLRVEFVGFVAGDQKWEFLRKSRFIVMPSEWYETFGMAIVEAYAAGRPVIGSNLGGIGSLVEDGVTGLLFRPGDPSHLARQIDTLWRAPEAVKRMGASARRVVEERFSPAAVHRQLIEIAEEVCARRNSQALIDDYCRSGSYE